VIKHEFARKNTVSGQTKETSRTYEQGPAKSQSGLEAIIEMTNKKLNVIVITFLSQSCMTFYHTSQDA